MSKEQETNVENAEPKKHTYTWQIHSSMTVDNEFETGEREIKKRKRKERKAKRRSKKKRKLMKMIEMLVEKDNGSDSESDSGSSDNSTDDDNSENEEGETQKATEGEIVPPPPPPPIEAPDHLLKTGGLLAALRKPQLGERVSLPYGTLTGVIMFWRDVSGCVVPRDPIAHPRLDPVEQTFFLHMKDIVDQPTGRGPIVPKRGDVVSFSVYEDHRGIGCHTVRLMKLHPDQMQEYCAYTEMRLLIDMHYVGKFIGTKGKPIQKMMAESGLKRLSTRKGEILDNHGFMIQKKCVLMAGNSDQLTAGAVAFAKFISKATQNTRSHMQWLVTRKTCGRIIGKKGSHMEQMRQKFPTISVRSRREQLTLEGTQYSMVTAFGPQEDIIKFIYYITPYVIFQSSSKLG